MAKTTKRTTTEQNAAQMYDARTKEVETIIQTVRFRLDLHRGRFRDSGSNDWGFVGDLGSIAEELKAIADRLVTK